MYTLWSKSGHFVGHSIDQHRSATHCEYLNFQLVLKAIMQQNGELSCLYWDIL
jgi:hypothetical protein